jgi:AraC-like DNA-binding protein
MMAGESSRELTNLATMSCCEPDEIVRGYSQWFPVRSFRSLVAAPQCLHRLGCVAINRITLASCSATDHRIVFAASAHLHLVVYFGGRTHIRIGAGSPAAGPPSTGASRPLTLTSPGAVALLPPAEIRCEGFHNLAVVRMDPRAVAAAAAAMAGVDGWSGQQSRAFAQFPAHSLPPAAPLARTLHCLLGSVDCCLDSAPRLARHLGFDDVILRSVASWLRPELLERDEGAAVRESGARDALDALIDYIRANLDQPLRLSDLEQRCHYSRRALEYAFRERFNTSPKQWIRAQRLLKAMELLRQRPQKRAIREVALTCGYRHMGHFSRHFKELHGCKPSEVMTPRG